jgi:thymidylate synthase
MTEEQQYLDIIKYILECGEDKDPRNGKTKSLFNGYQMRFSLADNKFPIITTKKIFIRGVFEELMFFLRGETNTNLLKEKGVNIWNANTNRTFLDENNLSHYKEGDIGTSYSFQFRHYGAEYKGYDYDYTSKGYDQLNNLISEIISNKYSRRLMMTTFNPAQIKQGVLPPCHGNIIQFNVTNENKLNCHMYQRSADWILGVPWNISSYAFLLKLIVELVNNNSSHNLVANQLIMTFGDTHIYSEHYDAANEQHQRIPFDFPIIKFNKKIKTIEELEWTDIEIVNYNFHANDFKISMKA